MRGLGKDPLAVIAKNTFPVCGAPILYPKPVFFTHGETYLLIAFSLRLPLTSQAANKRFYRIGLVVRNERDLSVFCEGCDRFGVGGQGGAVSGCWPFERRWCKQDCPSSLAC